MNQVLQYKVLQQGTSKQKPQKGQRVTVHYTGWLQDTTKVDGKGKEFDSSRKPNRDKFSFVFDMNRVIKGWDEAVGRMTVGERVEIIIPPHLGYGERGAPPAIPSNATLIFEIELFEIN